MRMRLFLILGGFVAACGGGAEEQSGEAKVLRWTAIPDQNTTELKRKYDPVSDYLSERLGVEVEYVPSMNYQASVDMFKNGDVHVAWFGGLTGVQARHAVEGARAIVQGEEDPKFYSYFIAHKDAGLSQGDELPVELAGKKFTFGSESSTSGRLMPEHFIMKKTGKTAMDFFEDTPNFSGSHDLTAELVDSGRYEAGVLNYKVFEKRKEAGQTKNCVVVWKTPYYADYNITAHPDVEKIFSEGFTDRLQKAFLEMSDEKLLGAFQRSGFIEASNEGFDGIKQVAIKLGKIRE